MDEPGNSILSEISQGQKTNTASFVESKKIELTEAENRMVVDMDWK